MCFSFFFRECWVCSEKMRIRFFFGSSVHWWSSPSTTQKPWIQKWEGVDGLRRHHNAQWKAIQNYIWGNLKYISPPSHLIYRFLLVRQCLDKFVNPIRMTFKAFCDNHDCTFFFFVDFWNRIISLVHFFSASALPPHLRKKSGSKTYPWTNHTLTNQTLKTPQFSLLFPDVVTVEIPRK